MGGKSPIHRGQTQLTEFDGFREPVFLGSTLDKGPARVRHRITISLRRHQGPAVGFQGPPNIKRGDTSFSRWSSHRSGAIHPAVLLELNQSLWRCTSVRDTGRSCIDIMAPGNYLLIPQISSCPEIERRAQVAGAFIDN